MSAKRVLLELQRPSPRIPDSSLPWRAVTARGIVDMVTFALHGTRVLAAGADPTRSAVLDPTSSRIPDSSELWRVAVRRPQELPRRLGVAIAEMTAMTARSTTRVLLALERPSPRLPEQTLSWTRRFGLAALMNVTAVALLLLLATGAALIHREPRSPRTSESPRMVFVLPPQDSLPGGGGGGGGNRRSGPIPRATATAARHEEPPQVEATPPAPPIETHTLVSTDAAVTGLPTVEAVPASAVLGIGEAGGAGTGEGTGAGSGSGPGQGPGQGGGEGDGVYRLGSGVIAPVLLFQVRPNYTARALAQRLQGSVLLEVIIRRDGLPDAIRVLRSLDPIGLDEEAIRAVRQWRFRPGRVGATPVDVLVTCIVDFSLR